MAKPKLALIPAAQGTKFYSVLPSDGTGDFTFTRGSVATRINAQGLIENVASGQSRLNYPLIDGVQKGCPHHILEPTSVNRIVNSQALSTWGQTNVTTTDNSAISPDGTLNASKITDNSVNGNHRVIEVAPTVNSSGEATYSIFLKKGTMTTCFVNMFSGATISNATVNLVDGTITNGAGTNHKIEKYPNDWFRVSIQGTLASTSTYVYIYLKQLSGYVGNGDFLYAWGGQLEELAQKTSYIPTSGTTVTRSAETANGAGNSTTFNDSEGVLMAEISALSNDDSARKIAIVEGSTQNQVSIGYSTSTKKIRAITYDGAVKGETFTNVYDVLSSNKVAYKYKSGDSVLWVNGFALDTSPNTNILDGVTLNSLNFNANTSDFFGKTKQVQYFDSILTDTQLEQLTSWQSFRDMADSQLYTIE